LNGSIGSHCNEKSNLRRITKQQERKMPQSLRCTHGILIHSTSSEPQPKPDIHSKTHTHTHTHTQYEIQQERVLNFTEEKEEEVANQRVVRNRAANL